jgi:DNA polymerase-3 subunit delta
VRLTFHQLRGHLRQPLLPVYLISGDEPLQHGEALDAVRRAAREQGHLEREVLEHDSHFDWDRLAALADNLSLFGDRRLIELRLGSSKIGAEGSKAVVNYLERPPQDTVLLIIAPKLERGQSSAKWVQSIDTAGALINIWPVDKDQLPGWLEQRMRSRGLHPGPGAAQWLAERVEGNLLAAVQELEKLLLLQEPGPVDQEQMAAVVADSARYTVFDLADSALEGRAERCSRVMSVLRAEDAPLPLILWALLRETRLLAGIAGEVAGGRPLSQAIGARREIWEKRRQLYSQASRRLRPQDWRRLLQRCAEADRCIKGRGLDDPWQVLEEIALGIAGAPVTMPVT